MKFAVFLFVGAIVRLTNSSKCPETKKPHETSCTIFYNCVNLPSGGYVWVPSKCTEGLVFQPYLRICVLPGDSWTCDVLATESTLVTNKYESPEVVDPSYTSYLGAIEEPSKFYEAIDSSYTIDDISHPSNPSMITPYPLIEVENSSIDAGGNEKVDNGKDFVRNGEHSVSQKRTNYLYEYVNRHQIPVPYVSRRTGTKQDHYAWLSQLISQLLIYKQLAVPGHWVTPPSSFYNVKTDVVTRPSFTSGEFYAPTKQQGNDLFLTKLIDTYVQNSLHDSANPDTRNMEVSQAPEKSVTESTNEISSTQRKMHNSDGEKNVLETLADNSNVVNNIIVINDYTKKKRYFTVDEYRSMAHQFETSDAYLLPCTKDVRLPNKTDCHKYYTCEPKTAYVTEYSCPSNTVFNEHARICTVQMQNSCNEKKTLSMKTISADDPSNETVPEAETSTKTICQEIGKAEDPTSDKHYYLCYSLSGSVTDVKSVRMACPRNLTFCRLKKICTTRQLCKKQE